MNIFFADTIINIKYRASALIMQLSTYVCRLYTACDTLYAAGFYNGVFFCFFFRGGYRIIEWFNMVISHASETSRTEEEQDNNNTPTSTMKTRQLPLCGQHL